MLPKSYDNKNGMQGPLSFITLKCWENMQFMTFFTV